MKLGIMQPYFMPYIGYWQLMAAVDKYVIFDDVNFIKRGWINRNNILVNGQAHLFSISLREASQNKLINEIEIADDFQKLKKTIVMSYKMAPYFVETMDLLNEVFSYEDKNLARFIGHSFEVVTAYLKLSCKFVYSSEIEKNNELKASQKILDICSQLGADVYVNAIGGQKLYDREIFAEKSIGLYFLNPEILPYKQFKNDFVSGLSMIDVMMFNSPEEINLMLDRFSLL